MSPQPPPSSPRRRKRFKPAVPELVLDLPEEELSHGPMTWRDYLALLRPSHGIGFGLSVGVHLVLATALAFWMIRAPRSLENQLVLESWFDTKLVAPAEPPARRPVTIPLASNSGSPKPATQPERPPENSGSSVASTNRPKVQSAADGRGEGGSALGNRGMGASSDGAALATAGSSTAAQRAVKAGLAWIVRQQTPEGKWELHQGYPDAGFAVVKTDTGATALAMLALQGAGNTHFAGEHSAVVKRGLKWLVDIQDPQTGDLHDQRQEEGRQPAFYAHAMATIVLCEALALTRDETLREPADKAVRYLIDSQHPQFGGWKYRPISRMMVGDLSVTGWSLMALHTARMAGITVAQEDFERAAGFLDSVQEQGGARYKYEPTDPANRVTVALTGEGLLCRQWLGWPRDYPPMTDGVKFLLAEENRPEWSAGRRNVYGWYYTAQTLHNLGGEDWKSWYVPVRDAIVKAQVTGGSSRAPNDVRGSWHPTQPAGRGEEYADKAGRLYITSLCVLILETPFRHRPLYED